MPNKVNKDLVRSDHSRWFFVSDLHAPETDKKALDRVLTACRDHKPTHVIIGGDMMNAEASSKFYNEPDYDLETEFKAAADIMAQFEDAAGGAELVFLEGNHENNLGRVGRLRKDVRRSLSYKERLPGFANGLWRIIPYTNDPNRGVYRLGQVTFHHGYSTSRKSDMEEAVMMGVPFGLTLRGHSHTPLPVTQARLTGGGIPLPYWYGNTGTLGPLKPEYANRDRTFDWGRGYALGTSKLGRAILPKPAWTGHVEIFDMASDLVRWDPNNG